MLGLETEAAAGHVDAGDDVVPKGFGAHTGVIVDLGPSWEATIGIRWSNEVGERFDRDRRGVRRFRTTVVAITDQSVMNDADVEFEISMFQYERCGATCAFEEETRDGFVRSLAQRN